MQAALAASGLLLGLAATPHCAAMCGAACAGVLRGCGAPAQGMLALQTGRLIGYTAAGAAVAASSALLGDWAREVALLKPFWAMLHAAAFVLGLWLLWQGRQPMWLERLGRGASRVATPAGQGAQGVHGVQRLHFHPGAAAGMKAGAAGLLWVAWPCGVLQSALVVAALGSGAADGALVMALFTLASGAGLALGPALWLRLAALGPSATLQTGALRLAGALLAAASAWAIGHDLLVRIADLCLGR